MDRMLGVNGTDLRVRIDGLDGAPWLVLSNSLGATLDMWDPQVVALSRDFRLLRYDTRGHGGSAVPPGPYTIEQLGTDVIGLLDLLGIERTHFCGLSMGGTTGMWLGAHAPSRLDRLVLCNTTPWLGPPDLMNSRIETVRRGGIEPLADAVMQRWFTPEFRASQSGTVARIRAALIATPAAGYVACCEALRDLDERASLVRIVSRTLVIGGTFDPAPTLEGARTLAGSIRGAEFVELPAAHLTSLGAAEQFTRRVLDFLLAQ